MRIAFYAPLKAPDHPVPSGDRLLAQNFITALSLAGHEVVVASRLRTYDRGDVQRQRRLAAVAAGVADRLVRRWQRAPQLAPHLWFTYHLYHKAPDAIGPIVSQRLRIPYVIAEASHAPKQHGGPWSEGYAAAEAAIRAADALVCLNPEDVEMLDTVRDASTPLRLLPPFIDVERFVAAAGDEAVQREAARLLPPAGVPRLITVAMMRGGDKLASYALLARALLRIADRPWSLLVVGDGDARAAVEAAFAPLGARVRFAGAQPPAIVAALLGACDVFAWPALREPIGLAMLEAQACGLPVVAGRRAGSASIVDDGATGVLVPPGDAGAFARAVSDLLDDPARRRTLGAGAARQAPERHGLAAAAAELDGLLRRVVAARQR